MAQSFNITYDIMGSSMRKYHTIYSAPYYKLTSGYTTNMYLFDNHIFYCEYYDKNYMKYKKYISLDNLIKEIKHLESNFEISCMSEDNLKNLKQCINKEFIRRNKK